MAILMPSSLKVWPVEDLGPLAVGLAPVLSASSQVAIGQVSPDYIPSLWGSIDDFMGFTREILLPRIMMPIRLF